MEINASERDEILVDFLRVENEEKSVSYYNRMHIKRCFRWMGCKIGACSKMSKMFFKILTKSMKIMRRVALKRFAEEKEKGALEEEEEYIGEESEEEEDEAPGARSFCSSSTDTTTAFFSRKFTYDSRFMSLQEFGLATKKVRNEKLNIRLIKLMSSVVSKQYLIKYRQNKEYMNSVLNFGGVMFLSEEDFLSIIKICLVAFNYNRIHRIEYFRQSCRFFSRKWFIIVLLGGTSGSGKSTLGSLLCARMGIDKFISTDSIRHCLREDKTLSKRERSILFCSSYTVGTLEYFSHIRNPLKRYIDGYKEHCELLYKHVDNLVRLFIRKRESVIIEGVHLNISTIVRLLRKYQGDNIFPFLVYVKSEKKHMMRFGVRSKLMTLDPNKNKYIKYIQKIRMIQNYLVKQSRLFSVPRIDNAVIDRSIAFLHFSVLRTIKNCVMNDGLVWDDVEKRCLNVDPNLFTEEVRTTRMKQVMRKKRLKMQTKNFQEAREEFVFDTRFKKRKKKKVKRRRKRRKRRVVEGGGGDALIDSSSTQGKSLTVQYSTEIHLGEKKKKKKKSRKSEVLKRKKKKQMKKDRLEIIARSVREQTKAYHSDGEVDPPQKQKKIRQHHHSEGKGTNSAIILGKGDVNEVFEEKEEEKIGEGEEDHRKEAEIKKKKRRRDDNDMKRKIKEELKIDDLLSRRDALFDELEAASEDDDDVDSEGNSSGIKSGDNATSELEEEEEELVKRRMMSKKKKKNDTKVFLVTTAKSMVSFNSSSDTSSDDSEGDEGDEEQNRIKRLHKEEERKYVDTYGNPSSGSSSSSSESEEEEEEEVGSSGLKRITVPISSPENVEHDEEYEEIEEFKKEKKRKSKTKEEQTKNKRRKEKKERERKKKMRKKKKNESRKREIVEVRIGGKTKKKTKTKKEAEAKAEEEEEEEEESASSKMKNEIKKEKMKKMKMSSSDDYFRVDVVERKYFSDSELL